MKKSAVSTVILIAVFIIGLSLLLYPTVSEYWNSLHQTRVISNYTSEVSNMDNEAYDALLESARAYNQRLWLKQNQFHVTGEDRNAYLQELDITGTGIMGYVEIPKLDTFLTIYHGTEERVLQTSVGHLEWSSLPVGGENTHCVISGHRGLPSARLFTDVDQLEEGDIFLLHVLDETLTYEVDQILIVEPEDSRNLTLKEGEDYCTLVTCTPYGVNSHRLLIRGHRTDNIPEEKVVRVTADAIQIEPIFVAPMLAAPLLLLLLVWLFIPGRKKK